MVRLDPMTEEEFREFRERGIARRAALRVAEGVWTEPEALATSRAEYDRQLAQGLATENVHFAIVRDGANGTRVGEVWYVVESKGGKTQFWVEWLTIDPAQRRRGHARELIRALTDEARRRGADRIGLYVRATNLEANALYDRAGFATSGRVLSLPVPP